MINAVAEQLPMPPVAVTHYPASGETLMPEPLVLLHGWGGDSRSWGALLPLLQEFTQVITVDLPGFGASDMVEDYSLDAVLKHLLEQLPPHAAYMGWSLGGMLATALAGRYPQRVTRLITVGANLRFAASGSPHCMPASTYREFLAAFAQSPAATLKRFCGLVAQGDPQERQLLKQLRQLNARCGTRSEELDNDNWLQALRLLGQIDNTELVAHLSQPGLHLFADGDALVPVNAAEHVRGLVAPRQQVQILDASGHAVHWSQPHRVAAAVRAFLAVEKYHLDKRKIADSFSRAAPTYDAVADLQRFVGEQLLRQVSVQAPARVVDLGCGTGCFSRQLLQQYPAATFLGLDIAEGMLHYARKRVQKAVIGASPRWLCADAEALPLTDESVDLVFSSLAIQWCENLPALFGELRRVLKPGGKAYLSTLGPRTLFELRTAWQSVDNYAHVNHFVAAGDLQQAIAGADLELVSWQARDRVLQYEQLRELTHQLKALGAHNVNSGQSAGLTGRRRLQQFREAYERFRRDGLLPATYEVYYLELSR